jgi:Protein of unknown function (DUF3309)
MSPLGIIVLVLLVVLLVGLLPHWPYARGWNVGYGPSGVLVIVLVIVLLLVLFGRI